MSTYRHGAYAEIASSRDYVSPGGVGTIPVYVGRAPIHQLSDYTGKTGVPLLISSFNDGAAKIGYSDDWKKFELCEAVYAHFRNSVQSVGPIIVINALDPADGENEATNSKSVTFSKRKAVIASSTAILKTIAIEGKVLGTDYTAAYADDGLSIILRDLTASIDTVTVTYKDTTPDGVVASDIVDALQAALSLVYYDLGNVPTLLCAPGWSTETSVYEALVNAAEKINGHWYAYVNADLDCAAAKTIDEAITAKQAYEVESGHASLLWPMGKRGSRLYHASVLNTVTMQWVDLSNDNLPYETPSNKRVDIDSLCLADGTVIKYDQTEANRLNAAGIDTMTYWEGTWRMWGPHTAAFTQDAVMDARDIFDCSVRMVRYVANLFQRQYGNEVDKSMTRARKDTILNDFQAQLDKMIANGALLLGEISFDEADNPVSDMVQGNFVFSTEVTNPVPGKSLTTTVRWTSDGLNTLYGEEETA